MELLICIAAATAAWVVGMVWYVAVRSPYERAIGSTVRNRGYPFDYSPMPYLLAGTCFLVIAVMLRGMFLRYGIHGFWEGLGIGIGLGTLIGLPLVLLHNIPPHRPASLTLIDGAHSILVLATLGAILGAI
ncbi:DUF1761 family protein [Paracoccus sp. S-4012]|uniref:DUF1761 domain-containing protein n=1 Tax=Paracoccus sp. S-4012 TaxID=2665648 RepID=UPI0012B02553|nr:DUF1761 domain-containing protein [Paracoccus sp. S-4012]MRX49653.1 DUF1761 family protein [Paracoccus sp. S-4012]